MRLGIIGVGIVGSAVLKYFEDKLNICCYDIHKEQYNNPNHLEEILKSEIIFLCLPTEYKKEILGYDYSIIEKYLEWANKHEYPGILILKSTVEPTKCQTWNDEYPKLNIVHNPEFLTSRSHIQDFENQTHIVLGYTLQSKDKVDQVKVLFEKYFPTSVYSIHHSTETEMMKIWCNSFYSIKIQIFNEIYFHAKTLDCNYDNVLNMMLKNNWINPMHTIVPGTDGQFGYGGACFPKDTNALLQHLKKNGVKHGILEKAIEERNSLRPHCIDKF